MKTTEIKCKSALSKSNLPGLDYSLNPYRGCQHSCLYCYVPDVLRINRADWGNFVEVKTNIPNVLAKELKKKKPGVVGLSTVTDPYQPIEKKYRLTRYCLERLLRYDFPVHIQTKSDLVLRDLDLISKFSNIEVMFSIGTVNDAERKLLEPYSMSIQNRLDAMKKVSEAGVRTSVFFGPIYPSITIDSVEKIINEFIDSGVKEIMIDKFNLKPGIYSNLEKFDFINKGKIKDSSYFYKISNEIHSICKKKEIKATNAF